MSWNILPAVANAAQALVARWTDTGALAAENQRAQLTLDSIGDAVVSTDLAGRMTYLNPAAESMTGWSRQEAAGRPLEEVLRIVDGSSREPAPNPMAMAMLLNKAAALGTNSVLIDRYGHESAIEDTAAPIRDPSGQVAGAVMVFRDVSAARALSLRMSHLAYHDFLTGLPNRLLLQERLAQTIASAHRHGKSLAVMFLDMDRFKQVNDTLGHAIGDRLLQSIAQRLAACVRGSDTVSRQGGDEFVVLLAEMARAEDAARVVDKIVAELSTPHHVGPHTLPATASIGIGVYPTDGTDAETLLKNADMALLRAKGEGRSTYRFFSSSTPEPAQAADPRAGRAAAAPLADRG